MEDMSVKPNRRSYKLRIYLQTDTIQNNEKISNEIIDSEINR